MWEYEVADYLVGDAYGNRPILYVERISGTKYVVPDGMFGNPRWEEQTRHNHNVAQMNAAYGVGGYADPAPRPVVEDYGYVYHDPYPGPGFQSHPAVQPPAKRSTDDMMRLLTKLSLLWEQRPERSLNDLISDLKYGRTYGSTSDEYLEREIDLRMAKP